MDFHDSDNHSYQEALDWLFSQLPMFSRIGAAAYKPGLETTQRLDEIFHHPHRKFKTIHVGGTNGKGSTSHMLAAVLQAQGYKTGLYTSPHLTDFRERMRINGSMIPREEVVKFVENWRRTDSGLRPSFFELTMMMAFDWFAREEVEYAVIEVGMGGRLDSTNIITPLLSVITNISFDHTQFLGTTLEQIAGEKAGIIKPETPVVIGEAEGRVKEVFVHKAREKHAPIYFAEDFTGLSDISKTDDGWKCEVDGVGTVNVPLAGYYQKKNIRTALCALHRLRDGIIEISPESIREGFGHVNSLTGLHGRWEIMGHCPTVICDTGHNVAGLTETLSSLKKRYQGRKIRFVVGFVNDKDVAHIVNLFPKEGIYYFTQASIPRAMDKGKVAEFFSRAGIQGREFADVALAYRTAMEESSKDDVIYVGGSTFIVADFLSLT